MLGVAPLTHRPSRFRRKAGPSSPRPELYAGVVRRRTRPPKKRQLGRGMLRDLSELKVGDPVVHEEHGIGRYQGPW